MATLIISICHNDIALTIKHIKQLTDNEENDIDYNGQSKHINKIDNNNDDIVIMLIINIKYR